MQKICTFLIFLSSLFGCGIVDNTIISDLPVEKKEAINEIKSTLDPQERKDVISSNPLNLPLQKGEIGGLPHVQKEDIEKLKAEQPKENITNQSKQEPVYFDDSGSSYVIPTLSVTDVIRADTNQSIVGTNAPASLTYAPETPVKLKITGNNFADATEPQKWEFYLVEYDPEILIETFIKKPVKKKVLLDDVIVLQPDSTGVFTPNELNVIFDSNGVLDASLTGLHDLKVYDGLKMAEVKIKFDKSDKKYNFQPTIQEIGIRNLEIGDKTPENDDDGNVGNAYMRSIEITGTNYFIDYKRNWAQVDDKRAYIHKVEILKGEGEIKQMKAEIYLPPDFIRKDGQNTISFATPYGSVLKMF